MQHKKATNSGIDFQTLLDTNKKLRAESKKLQADARELRADALHQQERLTRTVEVASKTIEKLEGANRQLTDKVIHAQEDERCRIGRELHDDFGQRLALMAMKADSLSSLVSGPDAAKRMISEISHEAKDLSSDIHRLSHRLHPPKVEELGLISATRALCKEHGKLWKMAVYFHTHGPSENFVSSSAMSLFRIIQESLQNAGKNGHARHVIVRLTADEHEMTLSVCDDGQGFEPSRVRRGLGLISMRERIRLAKGHITIQSVVGHGTRIEAHIPRHSD